MPKPFIVAEISKNWIDDVPMSPESMLLAEQFEMVIDYNFKRGYTLHTFALNRQMTSLNAMNETIIAVFRYAPGMKET